MALDLHKLDEILAMAESGRIEEALAQIKEWRASCSNREESYSLLLNEIRFLIELERTEEAESALNKATEFLPEAPPDFGARLGLLRAWSLRRRGDPEGALRVVKAVEKEFKRVLQASDSDDIREALQTEKGFLLVDLGRHKEALPILEKATSFQFWEAEIAFYLGISRYMTGALQPAVESLSCALELGLSAQNANIAHSYLGLAYYHLGAYARSAQEFHACEADLENVGTNLPMIRAHLSHAYRALGMVDEAEKYESLAKQMGVQFQRKGFRVGE